MSEQHENPSKPQSPTSSTNEPLTLKPQQSPPPQPTTKSQSTSGSKKSSSDQLKEFLDFIGDFFAWLGELLMSGIKFILAEIDKDRSASSQKQTVLEEQSIQNAPVTVQPALTDSPQVTSNSHNVNILGYPLDGWADLVEGMGSKAEEVREKVYKGLLERDLPERIGITTTNAFVSVTSKERRPYILTWTHPGATTTLYVEKHGTDLYVSWRTFIKPVLNWDVIVVMGFFAAVIGFVGEGLRSLFIESQFGYSSYSLPRAIWILVITFILQAFAVAFAGRVARGSFLAFFIRDPNIFNAEDITAMSLTAHKTLLRSLDSSGIDVTKLRLKQNFKGGRRDEMV